MARDYVINKLFAVALGRQAPSLVYGIFNSHCKTSGRLAAIRANFGQQSVQKSQIRTVLVPGANSNQIKLFRGVVACSRARRGGMLGPALQEACRCKEPISKIINRMSLRPHLRFVFGGICQGGIPFTTASTLQTSWAGGATKTLKPTIGPTTSRGDLLSDNMETSPAKGRFDMLLGPVVGFRVLFGPLSQSAMLMPLCKSQCDERTVLTVSTHGPLLVFLGEDCT